MADFIILSDTLDLCQLLALAAQSLSHGKRCLCESCNFLEVNYIDPGSVFDVAIAKYATSIS